MKKNIDVSQKVMKRVVNFENKRSSLWLLVIIAITAFLAITTLFIGLSALQKVLERQSLNLLTLFAEDPEIIAEFWKDTLMIFWQELPKEEIVIALLTLALLVLFEFKAGKKLLLVIKRLKKLAKYSGNPDN